MALEPAASSTSDAEQNHCARNVHLRLHLPRAPTRRIAMIDMQSQSDDRQIDLDQVGVSELRSPIVVLDRKMERQSTVATLNMSVALPHHFKGTHMSRFVEVLN